MAVYFCVSITAMMESIRQLEQALQRLGDEDHLLKMAWEFAPVALGVVNGFDKTSVGGIDKESFGQFVLANPAYQNMLGYTEEELTNLTFMDVTHPDDLDIDIELAEKVRRGEIDKYALPKRYIRKDGTIVSVILYVTGVLDEDGDFKYFLVSAADDTCPDHGRCLKGAASL